MRRQYISKNVSLSMIEQAVDDLCEQLRSNPQLRSEAIEAGVNLEAFDMDNECPFEVQRTAEGIGVIETFLIAVAARIAGEYVVRGLDKLWDDVFWPRLEQRFGDMLQPDEDDVGET
jgi:hypothetical protein